MTIHAYASGMLSAVGHDPVIAVRELSGEVRFAADKPEAAAVQLKMMTASMAVQNDVNDKDRREIERVMKEDVLETAKFPDVVFEAMQARIDTVNEGRYRIEVDGQLSLHGVTRSQRLSAQLFLMGETMRAQGEIPLRQTDFNIKPVSVAGGTLKIKDELKCVFDLLARKAT
jgi:polyisoprenoid-binding protein YceI